MLGQVADEYLFAAQVYLRQDVAEHFPCWADERPAVGVLQLAWCLTNYCYPILRCLRWKYVGNARRRGNGH